MQKLTLCLITDGSGSESNRPHHRLIAQNFETLMEEIGLSNHAAFIKSPKLQETERDVEIEQEDGTKKTVTQKELVEIEVEYTYCFRYEELITDIIRFAQLQKRRADKLEERLAKFVAIPQLAYSNTCLVYSMIQGNTAMFTAGKYYRIGDDIYYNEGGYLYKVG